MALRLQAPGGAFVCKFFDCMTRPTIDMLYLLSHVYDTVSIFKPVTSRPANSERYVICQGFRGAPKPLLDAVQRCLEAIHRTHTTGADTRYLASLLSPPSVVPATYIQAVRQINDRLAQHQADNIRATLGMLRRSTHVNRHYCSHIPDQVRKAVAWCHAHGVPVHPRAQAYMDNLQKMMDNGGYESDGEGGVVRVVEIP
jgi:hypothetical protein